MESPTGSDVIDWPEFQAFAARLKLNLEVPTRLIVIRLPFGEPANVVHEYDVPGDATP